MMKRHLSIGVVIVAVGLMTIGCVSTGTYKKMESTKNQEIADLRRDKTTVEQQRDALKQQLSVQQQQISSLTQQKDSLTQQLTAAQQQLGSAEQENAALLASSQQTQKQYEALVKGLSKEVEKGELQVKRYKNMLSVELAEQIFFDSGRAALKPGGKDVLKKVGEALKGYETKIIRVVGHTDNVQIGASLQSTFPSNWELSVARATTVVRFLQKVGVPPENMVASGRAEYDPVVPNDTPEGRQKNRRIEIMLIEKSLVSELGRQAN